MAYDIIIGRNSEDREKYGKSGTVLIGKQYISMGQTTSLSNEIYLDVTRSHVVFICGKRGGGKCLSGDTIITLEDGTQIPIKNLEKNSQDIFSLNSDFKVEQASKSEFYKRKVEKMLRVTLRTGKQIELTPEHPLFTVRGWVPADKLNVGSRIATPRIMPVFGKESISEDEVKIIAYLMAEGHLSNSFILFCNSDTKIIEDFKKAIYSFDPKLSINNHSSPICFRVVGNQVRKIIKQAERDIKGRFKTKPTTETRSSLRKWLDYLGVYGKLAYQRKLPDIFFKLSEHKTSLFLNRLFSCDGCIMEKQKFNWEVSYSSSSKIFIKQIQHLLLRFGIVSVIRSKKTKKRPSYEILIRGEFVGIFLDKIGFYGFKEQKAALAIKDIPQIIRNPNIDTIPKEVWDLYKPNNWAAIGRKLNYSIPKSIRESTRYSISRQKLLQIALVDENELLEKYAASDIFWDEITSIETLEGNFTVYDISVPTNHNFVANDIIVHNSYTMGVIAEGVADLPEEVSQNISVILLDTMGIYWTMKYPNRKDELLLNKWGFKGKGLNVKIYTPAGFYKKFKDEGIPTDYPFSINPTELTAYDWRLTFGLDQNDSVAVLIERIIHQLKEKGQQFNIDDIIKAIKEDPESGKTDKGAAENHFLASKEWGIFSEKATPLKDIVKGGQVTVLDVSCYAYMPGAEGLRALVIGLFSQKMFVQRMIERKKEEFNSIRSKMHYLTEEEQEKQEFPMVWLIIDEAHEFLPNKGKTAASDALITILREGRQPGISLILATQQPGKIHTDVMTQADVVLSHRLTAKIDTEALGTVMQSYMREGLDKQLNMLPRAKGAGIIFDDTNERLYPMQIRPRFTWHGGEAPNAMKEKKKYFDF